MKGPPLPRPRHPTVNEALAAAARGATGLTFVDVHEHDTPLRWADVLARASRMAGALHDLGIEHGDRVAIVLPTGPSFTDAFFGALLAGAVPVPLYPPVRLGRLDEYHASTTRMLELTSARMVLTDSRVALLLGEAIARARPPLGLHFAGELLARGHDRWRPGAPEELALIQFSSGSTVAPKPVALTHAQLMAQCAALQALMPDDAVPRAAGVSWLPLYHDMGLIGCLLAAVCYAGPLALLPPEAFLARPALWLRALSRFRATHSPAPNFAYGLCLKRIAPEELEGVDLSRWRYALNGAEPVSVELLHRFAARFGAYGLDPRALMPVYGLSEASLAVTFPPRRWPPKVARVDPLHLAACREVREGPRPIPSVGTPIPGMEVELLDEHGEPVPERRVGRIAARGPSVMSGYFGDAGATARALRGGWLDTGDLGFVLDGELFVCGRAKDLVIIRGANHAPQEFEECLEGLAGVRPGCAVAAGFVPDAGEGEALLLLVEGTAEAPPDLEERIRTCVLSRTGVRPHTVRLLSPGTLPRTSSGKLRRQEALRRFLAGELAAPREVTVPRMVSEVARSVVAYARARLSRDS